MKTYGRRICPICEKAFEATYPSQVCCSSKCQTKRIRGFNAANKRRHTRESCLDMDWLNAKLEDALAKIKALREQRRHSLVFIEPVYASLSDPLPIPQAEPEAIKVANDAPAPAPLTEDHKVICSYCGQRFKSRYADVCYCSDECVRAAGMAAMF